MLCCLTLTHTQLYITRIFSLPPYSLLNNREFQVRKKKKKSRSGQLVKILQVLTSKYARVWEVTNTVLFVGQGCESVRLFMVEVLQ